MKYDCKILILKDEHFGQLNTVSYEDVINLIVSSIRRPLCVYDEV
jgi:hypothetical protein